ncbi:MAG: hypothetical protein FGM39_10410 [Phycisphaerales bacterium]|nr:hypothetical protein [Phycisphaerales bacterium]
MKRISVVVLVVLMLGMLGTVAAQEALTPTPLPQGEDIPLFARIVAVADVYDALTSRRSYKEPWSDEQVAELLRKESGRHFDPEIVEIALGLLGFFRSVRERYASDSGH